MTLLWRDVRLAYLQILNQHSWFELSFFELWNVDMFAELCRQRGTEPFELLSSTPEELSLRKIVRTPRGAMAAISYDLTGSRLTSLFGDQLQVGPYTLPKQIRWAGPDGGLLPVLSTEVREPEAKVNDLPEQIQHNVDLINAKLAPLVSVDTSEVISDFKGRIT